MERGAREFMKSLISIHDTECQFIKTNSTKSGVAEGGVNELTIENGKLKVKERVAVLSYGFPLVIYMYPFRGSGGYDYFSDISPVRSFTLQSVFKQVFPILLLSQRR